MPEQMLDEKPREKTLDEKLYPALPGRKEEGKRTEIKHRYNAELGEILYPERPEQYADVWENGTVEDVIRGAVIFY